MAPTNKVTKAKDSPVKTPTSKRNGRPRKPGSPTKSRSAIFTESNFKLLWACLKGFLRDGHTINYDPVATEFGITKNAAQVRFCRLKAALEQTESPNDGQETEDVKEEPMNMVKTESRRSTPVEEKNFYVKIESMEEA